MLARLSAALLLLLLLPHGCSNLGLPPLKYRAVGASPEILAVYEPWFGHPKHISVGYSSHDPDVIREQIRRAKAMGISGFVVDWYGDRDPFNSQTYALMQTIAAQENFHVAMMYDESSDEDGATDVSFAGFKLFHDTYLSPNSPGRAAYLTYEGRPVIFIFPKGGRTDWNRIRSEVNKWSPAPFLLYENEPGKFVNAFDGFYAWINPGPKGWAPDGSDWGQEYLSNFYQTMRSKYPDKIAVGGAWASFDDSKASWSINRHMSARCGQTFKDTFNFWRQYYAADDPLPFVLIETWNDYEEGSAIERGIPTCGAQPQQQQQH
jgi:hypothetical protein